jgi:two-component system, LytTR family, response regulator
MNSPITAIIVDDEILAIANLESLLSTYPRIRVVKKITDPTKAIPLIIENKPDLLFLDIQMPGKSGFEIVSELSLEDYSPEIIFVTGFDHFAIEAIRFAAFDYLVKPVNPEELKQAISRFEEKSWDGTTEEKIKKLLDRTISKPKIKLSTAGGFTIINPDDIIYINADWNYAEIICCNDKSEMATTNLGTLEKTLPENSFFRISRSVIINTAYLTKVSRKKRLAYLVKDGKEYTFKIPLLNIRKLEMFLDNQ